MFKLKTYYDKEKLPTIYSPNAPLKSLSQKRKINYQNFFDQTFSNGIYDLNKNSYEQIKFLLKVMDNREKSNNIFVHNKIMTIYNKNRFKKNTNNSYTNNNQRTKYKSYSNQTHVLSSKTYLQNNISNDTNIAFNESYHNFINNLKNKKLSLKTSNFSRKRNIQRF